MTVVKRHSMFYHIIFFSLLSLLMVHISQALSVEKSALSFALLKDFLSNSHLLLVLFGLLILFSFFLSKFSLYLYYSSSIVTSFVLFNLLYQDFNKSILLINFFYIIIIYSLGQVWHQVLSLACYNTRLSGNAINDKTLIKIKVNLQTQHKTTHSGFLTNWDESSCFVTLEKEGQKHLKGLVDVIVNYNGQEFKNSGQIVSRLNQQGVGVLFHENKKNKFNWQGFYSIMEEMSFTPRYLTH